MDGVFPFDLAVGAEVLLQLLKFKGSPIFELSAGGHGLDPFAFKFFQDGKLPAAEHSFGAVVEMNFVSVLRIGGGLGNDRHRTRRRSILSRQYDWRHSSSRCVCQARESGSPDGSLRF